MLEYLTHDHALAEAHLGDAEILSRLRQELEGRKVETEAILTT
jgi:hypothetical protein